MRGFSINIILITFDSSLIVPLLSVIYAWKSRCASRVILSFLPKSQRVSFVIFFYYFLLHVNSIQLDWNQTNPFVSQFGIIVGFLYKKNVSELL